MEEHEAMQDYLNVTRSGITMRELAELAAEGGHPVPEEQILEAEEDLEIINWAKTNAVHKGIESRWKRLREKHHHFDEDGTHHQKQGSADIALIDDGNWLLTLDDPKNKIGNKQRGADTFDNGCCSIF